LVYFYEDHRAELYNLAADPEEKTDLSKTQSAKALELGAKLRQILTEQGAQMPVPNR
jgi:hypothetical protein